MESGNMKYKPCPKCGSKEGYTYEMWTKYNQWVDMNGKGISAEATDGKGASIYECVECHSRFREKTILNENANPD